MFRWVYSKVVKKGASAWNDHHFVLLLSVHRTNTVTIFNFMGAKFHGLTMIDMFWTLEFMDINLYAILPKKKV